MIIRRGELPGAPNRSCGSEDAVMNSIRKRILLPLAPALFFALCASAGVIKGKVTDADGNPLREVRITLSDAATGKTYVLKTDKKGDYLRKGIDPSNYTMKIEKEGYLPLEGRILIGPEPEVVRNAVLARVAERPVKPEWEGADLEARRIYKEGRYEEALKLYRDIQSRNPELAQFPFYAGNCLFHLGRYDEALAAFKEAVRLKPDFFEAYTNLASAFGKLNRFDEGLQLFEPAMVAYPESLSILTGAGLLYLSSGRSDKAVACLEKAASLDADARRSFHALGMAYTQQGDLAKAIAAFRKFLSLNTDPAEAARVQGIIDQLEASAKK